MHKIVLVFYAITLLWFLTIEIYYVLTLNLVCVIFVSGCFASFLYVPERLTQASSFFSTTYTTNYRVVCFVSFFTSNVFYVGLIDRLVLNRYFYFFSFGLLEILCLDLA